MARRCRSTLRLGSARLPRHTSNDVVTLLATSNGTATWTFAIPARPALASLVVYQQGVSFDPLVARPLPAAVSNAGRGDAAVSRRATRAGPRTAVHSALFAAIAARSVLCR